MTVIVHFTHIPEDLYGDFLERARELAKIYGAELMVERVEDVE